MYDCCDLWYCYTATGICRSKPPCPVFCLSSEAGMLFHEKIALEVVEWVQYVYVGGVSQKTTKCFFFYHQRSIPCQGCTIISILVINRLCSQNHNDSYQIRFKSINSACALQLITHVHVIWHDLNLVTEANPLPPKHCSSTAWKFLGLSAKMES